MFCFISDWGRVTAQLKLQARLPVSHITMAILYSNERCAKTTAINLLNSELWYYTKLYLVTKVNWSLLEVSLLIVFSSYTRQSRPWHLEDTLRPALMETLGETLSSSTIILNLFSSSSIFSRCYIDIMHSEMSLRNYSPSTLRWPYSVLAISMSRVLVRYLLQCFSRYRERIVT